MEDAIDGDAPLDYVSIQIFPSQNRYEAFVCKEKQSENVAAGHLEHLLLHVAGINDPNAKGFDNFDLELPENLHGAEWFSKVTVQRFLRVVGTPDFLKVINTVMNEMSRLESKKFHLSLYEKDQQDHRENKQRDGCNSYDVAPTSKPEVNIPSSNASKNELLQAMDIRLTALRNKLAETFNKAIGATMSPKDMTYLAKFSHHFGAANIENSLFKFMELNQNNQAVGSLINKTTLFTCDVKDDNANRAIKNLQISKPVHSDTPVKYGVSPAKAAQVERQSSTESEESSNSSDEGQISAERSRSLGRSASLRRSASPMRRIQMGRSGPHRAAALAMNSLNVFPARERPISYRDTSENDCDEEASEQHYKKPEIDVRRITVQDAITLFESKQQDQTVDIQNRKSLTDVSISTKKSVLRRWSTGMGETYVQGQPEIVPAEPVPLISNDAIHVEIPKDSKVEVVSDIISESHNMNEMTGCDVKLERQENIGSDTETVDNQAETEPKVGGEIAKKLAASAEWNKQKQVEFNQILEKMIESKPVKFGKSQPNKNQNMPVEHRGGSYDHHNYKDKRDAKLQGESAGKQVAQFQEMQQILHKKKAITASRNVSSSKKDSTKNPQKSLRNSTQPANSPKENSRTSVTNRLSPKTSSIPATRKSWPSTPSARAGGTSPAKVCRGTSSASSTHLKPQSTVSVPHSSPQREKSQQQSRTEKDTKTNNIKSLKSIKERPAGPSKNKAIKAKVTTASVETPVPSKLALCNKGTKRSSVVPLESKPFIRKGSGVGHGTGNLNKKKNSLPLEQSLRESEDLAEDKESGLLINASDLVIQASERDTLTPSHQNAAAEPESQIINHFQCGETENLDEAPAEGGDVLTNESSLIIKTEEESTISPSAWVEIEEELELPKPWEDSTFQHSSLANIPPVGSASPHVRHSLFHMIQEEISKPRTSEWGNAEIPPAILYQKGASKGLKRLLKFARKSKGDTGSTGWSSPTVFSEAEEGTEEFKFSTKRNADNLLRKAALNAKSYGLSKSSLHGGCEKNKGSKLDGNSSHKMQEGRDSGADRTTKASRSFFSLSAFRGNKPTETKFH